MPIERTVSVFTKFHTPISKNQKQIELRAKMSEASQQYLGMLQWKVGDKLKFTFSGKGGQPITTNITKTEEKTYGKISDEEMGKIAGDPGIVRATFHKLVSDIYPGIADDTEVLLIHFKRG